jgi:hypothetical protein
MAVLVLLASCSSGPALTAPPDDLQHPKPAGGV